MKYRVNVTQHDLDNGDPTDQLCCPIQIAMTRTLGREVAIVGTGTWRFANSWLERPLPWRAFRREIWLRVWPFRSFKGPFSFDVEAPGVYALQPRKTALQEANEIVRELVNA